MAPFTDYYDLIDPLILPIRGKQYTIPTVSADSIVRWKRYGDLVRAGKQPTGAQAITDEQFLIMFLGDALTQMRDDAVPGEVIIHAARTAVADAELGRTVAELAWTNTDPKAPTPPPTPSKGSTRSRSTVTADTTNSRARTSGTTSPRK